MWKIEQQRRVVRNMSNIKHFGNFPTVCITVLSKDASDTVAFLSESIHNTTNKNMIHVTELVWSWLLYLWYSFTCRAACYQHVSGLACIYNHGKTPALSNQEVCCIVVVLCCCDRFAVTL